MIQAKTQIKQLNIGQIQMTKNGVSQYTTCVICCDSFALIPAIILQDITSNDCIFIEKGRHSQTISRRKFQKIIKSSSCELAILILDESRFLIHQLKDLQISINAEQQRKADIFGENQIRMHGYHILNQIINRKPTFSSQRIIISCQYSLIVDNDIHYDSYENNDGFIGAALSMEEERWIGIHQGSRWHKNCGILFTENIINQLISMVKNQTSKIPSVLEYQQILTLGKFENIQTENIYEGDDGFAQFHTYLLQEYQQDYRNTADYEHGYL